MLPLASVTPAQFPTGERLIDTEAVAKGECFLSQSADDWERAICFKLGLTTTPVQY